MSGMADEMAARMEADGNAGLGGAAEPGTGADNGASAPAPPAEALTTDTQGEGEPGPVPYSRFKEVNEGYQALRGYQTLADYGYDPDSLSRLAAFEAAYAEDPSGTVFKLADNLDLPDEAKTQLRSLLEVDADESPDGGGTPDTPQQSTSDDPPLWARPLLEKHQQDLLREEDDTRNALLDETLAYWDASDKSDGIETPMDVKLDYVTAHASRGYQTTQALAEGARAARLKAREADLGSAVQRAGNVPGPRSVPRSVATPSEPFNFGTDIRAATRAAEAAIERGELRGLGE